MPYFAPQEVPVRCPGCGFEMPVQVYSIVDAQDMPLETQGLIAGALNMFQCPRCGMTGMLNFPLFYHDGKKQLAFVYVSPTANLTQEQRQRIIGEMTRAVMSALPEGQPRGYLLQPREFITLENMLDAIMEAEGIDKNVLEERRRKAGLIDQLLAVMDDSVAFSALVGRNKEHLDQEFYELLRYARDASREAGQRQEAERLEALRQRLLPLTAWGQKEQAYDRALALLHQNPNRQDILERLLHAASEDEVEALVRVFRPLLDYLFFKMLSERIEQVRGDDPAEAERLTQLRERILNLTELVDKETQQAVEGAAELLRTLLRSEDINQAIEENLQKIDDVFLFVLSSQIKQAEKEGLKEIRESLERVWQAIQRHLQPEVPPELAFIEQLLTLSYPEESRQYLQEHRDLLSPPLIELMEALAQDMERQGIKDVSGHLRQIRAQALALLAT